MTGRKHRDPVLLAALFLIFLSVSQTWTQIGQSRINLSPPDTSEFPEISFNLVAVDPEGRLISDLSSLQISEDGNAIEAFSTETVPVGAEVIMVIDANRDIEDRDEAGGLSRREKVRESILRFVDLYMDPEFIDRVSIIVPDEQSGRFLEEQGIMFHNSVKNAVNFYLPSELRETPLQNMMEMALQQAEQGREEGRSAAVVLFSDGNLIGEQLEFEELTSQAAAMDIVLHQAILGATAETWAIDDARRLTEPTGGYFLHMPQPGDADPIYELIRNRAAVSEVHYRSALNTTGEHTLTAEIDGVTTEVPFSLVVAPPAVHLAIDNSRPIIRVAPEALTPLEEAEPKSQPLAAVISWPDSHPRELTEVTILVDGDPRSPLVPVLDASGLLTFDWDLREFGGGDYALQVEVEDELGLSSISDPLPITIELNQPEFQPTPTPEPTPTPVPSPTPAPTATPEPTPLIDIVRDNALFLGSGAAVALLLVLAILLMVFILGRRRKKKAAPTSAGPAAADTLVRAPTGTQVTSKIPLAALAAGAYLEPLEHAPDHVSLIPLTGNNVALGRDPKAVQILLNDQSVSGLHARILESHGSYRIYDEGSTSGTYVNFQRIGLTPRILDNRDDIHLGRVHLRFHLVSPPPRKRDNEHEEQPPGEG